MIRVMVVDDNDLLRSALRESLYAERGVEIVAECRDGQEAAEQLGGLEPDVVVTDLSMPRLNGVDLTRLIMQRLPATRVFVLTAAPHGHLAEEALAAGASAVLAKGSPLDDLVAAILAAPRQAQGAAVTVCSVSRRIVPDDPLLTDDRHHPHDPRRSEDRPGPHLVRRRVRGPRRR